MRLLINFLICYLISLSSLGQDILFLNHFSSNEINNYVADNFTLKFEQNGLLTNDVSMYRLSYEMPFLENQITVSGAVFIPETLNSEDEFPIVVFNHGTTFIRTNAPSFKQEINNLGFYISSLGFVVLMPDYVGLGESEITHPYCHAQSESDSGWFLVQSFIDSLDYFGLNINGNLFISGYSQGGHVAMAMAKNSPPVSIQDQIQVTAVAPLSGPYDLSGIQLPYAFQQISYSNPAYLLYILKGWNSVYGNIYEDLSDICLEPYASIIEPMLDGFHSAEEINNECPELLTDLFPEYIIEDVLGNPNNIIMEFAQENDVYKWVPNMPVHMRYCTGDEEVFYQNAISAELWMVENGSSNIVAYNLGDFNHNECAFSAIINSMLWFYSLNSGGALSIIESTETADDYCEVYDLFGRLVYEGEFDLERLNNYHGIYLIKYKSQIKPRKMYLGK
jgi:hypothetical protein